MTVLVTGAAGFVGSALVRRLGEERDVVAVHRPGATPPEAPDRVRWLPHDLSCALPDDLPDRMDAVVHLAQSSRYREFPDGAVDMVDVNVGSTTRLLQYALRAGASSAVVCSTGAVYAPGPEPVAEDDAPQPPNFYATSKLLAEQVAAAFRDELPVAVLRPFFVYGPGQQLDRFLPGLVRRIADGEPVRLAGEDGIRMNPLYVDDAVEAIVAACDRQVSETVNIAGQEVATIRRIAELVGVAVERPPVFEAVEPAEDLVADVGRMAAVLPPAQVGLADGVGRTARWVASTVAG